ncbi:MAG: hypothetical protein FD123_3167 [Bacteroidetes bacterium]|nr:MAG: hypothetical protein FD123_3167 [Bacteroidota bacterium]
MSTNIHTDRIFTATSCLSEKELTDYCGGKLDGKNQHRLERHLTDCALCSAAVAAFAATPAAIADIPQVKNSVAAKAGKMAVGLGTGFVLAFAVVGLLVFGVFVKMIFWPDDNTPQENKVVAAVVDTPAKAIAGVPAQMPEEYFIKPGAAVHKTESPVASVSPVDTQAKKTVEVEPFEPIAAKEVSLVPGKTNDSKEAEDPLVQESYNAPVVYVRDLKITDFEKYYREKIEIKPLMTSGLSAKFDHHDQDYEDDSETVRTVPADKVLDDGLNYFNQGRYGKSISQFDMLLDHNPKDINAQFYVAICNVRLEMYSRALPLLDKVLASENNVFHQEAEWYKALALLGMKNRKENAKTLLKQIADRKGFYRKQALEKLKELE